MKSQSHILHALSLSQKEIMHKLKKKHLLLVNKYHQYLYGQRFTLVTDHKPLLAILGPEKGIPSLAAAPRLQRWSILLAAYLYIEFKPTKDHSNADG